jgi:hypothetical protein
MKRIALFIVLFSWLTGGQTVAQETNQGRVAQRIEAMKSAFITDRLRLSPEEAQQFWPLYNEYEAAEKRIREQYRPGKPVPDMSDAEAEALLNDRLKMEEKLLDLKAQYIQRFKSVIPARKVAMLPKVEEEFKRELLKRMQESRQRRNN